MEYTVQKYLVTGAAGQLGYELHRRLCVAERSLPKTRETLDITQFKPLYAWLAATKPDVIINCAGYTDVVRAEAEPERARLANSLGVSNLACCAARLDIPLVHVSTNYVFGGEPKRRQPYRESDPVAPLNVYGQSKVNGEHAILHWASVRPFPWWIIRTAGLFERPWRYRMNFPTEVTQALRCRSFRQVEVVSDVRTNITYVPHLARAILWIIEHREQIPHGIYHITNQGECTWYDVARILAKSTNFWYKLRPISREDYAYRYSRKRSTMPPYSCLDNSRYLKLGGPQLPGWETALEEWKKDCKDEQPMRVA